MKQVCIYKITGWRSIFFASGIFMMHVLLFAQDDHVNQAPVLVSNSARIPIDLQYEPKQQLEVPPSVRFSGLQLKVPVQSLQELDLLSIENEDKKTDIDMMHPFRGGIVRPLQIDPFKQGQWSPLPDSGTLWAMAIQSPKALAVQLRIKLLDLPKGAKLYVYSPDAKDKVMTFEGRYAGDRWSSLFTGDTIDLELYLPPGTPQQSVELVLASISHIYRFPGIQSQGNGPRAQDTAASCEIDASCYPSWATTAMSVGRVNLTTASAVIYCSGTLLNNLSQDYSPLFLSANHCFPDGDTVNGIFIAWNYATPSCNWGTSGFSEQTIGANTLARDANTDFALFELTNVVPQSLTWAGWNAVDIPVTTSMTGIHYPEGDFRHISFGTRNSDDINFPGFFNIGFNLGIIEPGSSGSPLFDPNHNVTGTLTGTPTASPISCSNPTGEALYSKLSDYYPFIQNYLQNGLPDDSNPPNHTRATALPLSSGSYSNLVVKITADDWYDITVPQGQELVWQFQNPGNGYFPSVEFFIDQSTTRSAYLEGGMDPVFVAASGNDMHVFAHVFVQGGTRTYYGMDAIVEGPTAPVFDPNQSGGEVMNDSIFFTAVLDTKGWDTTLWLEYGTSSDPNTFLKYGSYNLSASFGNESFCCVTIQNLLPGTTYYYRIAAQNAGGTSYTSIQSGTTLVAPPTQGPMLTFPVPGSMNAPLLPTFTWVPVTGASYFTLDVGTVDSPSAIVDQQPQFTSWTPLQNLEPDTDFFVVMKTFFPGASVPVSNFSFHTVVGDGIKVTPRELLLTTSETVAPTGSFTVTNTSQSRTVQFSSYTNSPFADSNNCPTLAPGASCTVTISHPTEQSNGSYSDFQRVSFITNTGYDFELPAFSIYGASFSATSLDFSDVVVGVTISKVITVTNIGQSPINNRFSTSSVGFSETDDYPNPIPAGANCHITVSFQPVNTGLALGVISISAPFIPTGLPLRGIGSNITILPSRPTRLRFGQSTVVAGQSMDYSFALAMNDFNTEQVMLACDDLPPGVSCRIEPEQKVLTRSPSEFVVHITTTNDLDHSLRLRDTVNQATSTPTGSYTIHLKVKSSKGDLEIPIPMTVK